MDKVKKKRIKKYISWVCMVSFVALLAMMPLMANSRQEADGPQASILSGTVETGSITTSLQGGGTLTSEKPVEIRIPSGVMISEFLVKNGDLVSEGDPLAAIDKVSLMAAITGVQDTMDYLVEEMASTSNQQTSTRLTAQAGGLVKQVFAEKGDSVQDVMLEHGALAVLSLDGLMAVEIKRSTDLATGDGVSVMFEDGTEAAGRVESNMDGILVVTVEDDGYRVGETVVVTTVDGSRIGSGQLYVHNAWKAVAYTGTVETVSIKPEDNTYDGQTILTLSGSDFNAQRESLASQHREYEELMLELFKLYQAEAILAPCDGMVSGVDENSIHLLSGTRDSLIIDLLANAPGSDPDGLYDNHIGQITGMLGSDWTVRMDPESQEVADYMADMETVDTAIENMTYQTMMEMVTVYQLVDGEWEITTAEPGDILLFALGNEGFVWAVYIDTADTEPSAPSETPSEPSEPAEEDTESTEAPEDGTEPTLPEISGDMESTEDSLLPSIPSIGGSIGSMMGGFTGSMPQEEEYVLYDLEGSTLMSLIPQKEMTLSMQLDEQDISKVHLGMQAEVTVEALNNQVFPAVVTEIGDTGTNLGGSSKFTVKLTLQMQEQMLSGMSATATIPLFTTDNALLIPVEALVEEGSQTMVYTGYDESTGELINPVAVTLGSSDAYHAEIRSGLNVGDTYWYRYYDTLEIDHAVDTPGFRFG